MLLTGCAAKESSPARGAPTSPDQVEGELVDVPQVGERDAARLVP
jgi:hypothetical protein